MSRDRTDIYYWKCDREAAFHGTSDYERDQSELTAALGRALTARFGARVSDLAVSVGQGNHRTFTVTLDGRKAFVRTEDGVEADNYFAVEAAVTARVAALGVPVAETLAYDCSRTCGFAWQIIPFVDCRDLNRYVKDGTIDWTDIAPAIGAAIAKWQAVTAPGFGPFSAARALATGELLALHPTYEAYYRLNLVRHVRYLVDGGFLSEAAAARVFAAVDAHADVLKLERGVLVHKDLAVWNILGTPRAVSTFIDWDDCIMGDATDDLSLMGVTGDDAVTRRIVAAYFATAGRDPGARDGTAFWLCWLRNILFKAVIRLGAGYFKKTGDGFFLIGGGKDGSDLASVTRGKIEQALAALEKGKGFDAL